MHVIHVAAGLWRHTGGPAEVIPNLCMALARYGCRVTLATVNGLHSDSTLRCPDNGVEVVGFDAVPFSPIRYTPELSHYLKSATRTADIIHNHGHWLHPNWAAYYYAMSRQKPLVTTPHGTLVPGMLAVSSLKKQLAWFFVEQHLIRYASVVHALTEAEAAEMASKIGDATSKIIVIPNGVDIWDIGSTVDTHEKLSQVADRKILLFLSRVHKIKGIVDLINVWRKLCNEYPQWHLVVVGQIDEAVSADMRIIAADWQLSGSMTVTGPIYGDERAQLFANADAFVLPSYGEGLPTALLEALSCGLPVVYTDECNFPLGETSGAGFKGPAGERELESNLRRLFKLSEQERASMGEKGVELIRSQFLWDRIAGKWVSVYRDILNGTR